MAQLTPIKGFHNVPVTKTIIILTTIIPILLGVFELKYLIQFNMDYILEYNQFWRILSFQISVLNESDYLLVMIVFWYYKTLERFYGSEKYLTLVIILFIYNALITSVIILILQILQNMLVKQFTNINWQLGNQIASGPLGLLSSFYICYSTYIPVNYLFEIELRNSKFTFTNHFPLQLIFLLLFINNGINSIFPMVLGLIYGKFLINDLLILPKFRLPEVIYNLFTQPSKVFASFPSTIAYQPISQSENPIVIEDQENDDDDDDDEQADNQIRAETPVRPLTGQFIDTFRN